MRKITRQIVWLFVVFVIYFGYSAFVDGVAIFHIKDIINVFNGAEKVAELSPGMIMGSASWNSAKILWNEVNGFYLMEGYTATINGVSGITNLNQFIGGFMAPTSLLYTILIPFKLVLVGGVFAMLIPLTKSIFFGTIIGIKDYVKARQGNILFNYQKTIAFTKNLQEKLRVGDYEEIKVEYAAYNGLAFKPIFLANMMNSIGRALIKESSVKSYVEPCGDIVKSLQEMYGKERKVAIKGRPDEMFFDFKMGYDYTSTGSKYAIQYYKVLETKTSSKNWLAWKLFSLEMFRFFIFMLLAIIPTVIINAIVLPIVGVKDTGNALSFTAPLMIVVIFFLISIILHVSFTFNKKVYRSLRKNMIIPAICYYGLILILALTLSLGINGIKQVGSIIDQGTATSKIWPFFAALGYAILSTCLILYIISTIMDANKSVNGMTKKILIDGIILPTIAWILSTGFNFVGILAKLDMSLWSGIAFAVLAGFWIYLSISSFLLNNIIFPSIKKQKELHNRLAQEGLAAKHKKQENKSKDK